MSISDSDFADPLQTDQGDETQWSRKRREDVLACPLSPVSLVGSWFHKIEGGEITWQGVVIGEPQPGIYLLEVLDWKHGAPVEQRLYKLDHMVEEQWRFFDSDEWMRWRYDEWGITHADQA
jgi:hypothetical protein